MTPLHPLEYALWRTDTRYDSALMEATFAPSRTLDDDPSPAARYPGRAAIPGHPEPEE